MKVTSPAFSNGDKIPMLYTGEGKDISPAIFWERTHENVKEYALICEDPDAPSRDPFVHWVVYKIPGYYPFLSEGEPGLSTPGKNSFGKVGYSGPLPPKGRGEHRYFFKLYALDKLIDLEPGLSKEDLLKKINGHIVDQGELMGKYVRN